MKRAKYLLLVVTLFTAHNIKAQGDIEDSTSHSEYLKIFLEGFPEWDNYIKVHLWYVDYVRDPKLCKYKLFPHNKPLHQEE